MKKKTLALILAGIMTFSCSAISFAAEETEDTGVYTYDMMDESLYDGTWLTFNDEIDIYLPSDWDVLELTDEAEEDGVVLNAAAPDDSGQKIVVQISQLDKEYESLEEVSKELEDAGYKDVEIVTINDIPSVTYDTDDVYGITFINTDMVMYNVVISPRGSEGLDQIAANIMLSISPTESGEEGTEEDASDEEAADEDAAEEEAK